MMGWLIDGYSYMRAIQKQYEKRIKVNQNKDTFTTYQRMSQQDHSPILLQQKQNASHKSKHDNQHLHIESLKCTLKSLSQQASMDFSKVSSKAEAVSQDVEHKKYNNKLDQLSKNLQEIASKCYFSPANSIGQRPKSSTYYYNNNNGYQKQQLDKSEKIQSLPAKSQQYHGLNYNAHLFPQSKSQILLKHDHSQASSKNKSQNKSQHHEKDKQDALWSGKSQFKSSSKKTFSKKEIISQPFNNPNSKNLTKIFQKYQENQPPRIRERADTHIKCNQTVLSKCIHRARVTSILISDQIYTSSLDYTVQRFSEHEGEFQTTVVDRYRGGVQFIGLINSKIYGLGRDCYLRSIEGNYHCKFTSTPISFYESERSNQISIGFINNVVELFDMEKRASVSSVIAERAYKLMSKWDKQLYLGQNSGLKCIDWRKKDHFIQLLKTNDTSTKNWMSLPFEKQFAYHSNNQICLIPKSTKAAHSIKLPNNQIFKSYDWNRLGLNLLTFNESINTLKLVRLKGQSERQEVDIESNGRNIVLVGVRQKQIIYGGSRGQVIIKKVKK